jgi:hypothetical protein
MMSHAWQPILATITTDSILKQEMAPVNANLDAIPEEGDDSMAWHD